MGFNFRRLKVRLWWANAFRFFFLKVAASHWISCLYAHCSCSIIPISDGVFHSYKISLHSDHSPHLLAGCMLVWFLELLDEGELTGPERQKCRCIQILQLGDWVEGSWCLSLPPCMNSLETHVICLNQVLRVGSRKPHSLTWRRWWS